SGINISNVQVQDATHLTASVAVTLGAALGARNVVVTTGGEVATLANGFSVTALVPPSIQISPDHAKQGDSFTLAITGTNTHFTTENPGPSLTLGGEIAVSNLQVLSDTSITAMIDIDPLAVTGARTGKLSSGATNFDVPFTVQPSNAAIANVSPG